MRMNLFLSIAGMLAVSSVSYADEDTLSEHEHISPIIKNGELLPGEMNIAIAAKSRH